LRAGSSEDDMDLTPMVDVTFLLLIFFMITAAFALQKALEVPPVEDEEAAPTQTVDDLEVDSVVIRIDADNVFWIGAPKWDEEQRAPSVQDMLVKLREARESVKGAGAKLLVQANGDSRHEFVVAALDAGSGVGMEEIRLMSYEEGDLDF
ncbi:MAG: biopolymer transporter ExbD, partial [Pirellulales bacterium]|nr:biopolymer transporter ExbD [Pirellulales bacterium]